MLKNHRVHDKGIDGAILQHNFGFEKYVFNQRDGIKVPYLVRRYRHLLEQLLLEKQRKAFLQPHQSLRKMPRHMLIV